MAFTLAKKLSSVAQRGLASARHASSLKNVVVIGAAGGIGQPLVRCHGAQGRSPAVHVVPRGC